MSNWRPDLSDSAFDFTRLVWPAISRILGPGDLHVAETSQDPLMRSLDMLAGIDAWQVNASAGMRGIASRVQWKEHAAFNWPYYTFTIRKKRDTGTLTEFQKRIRALDNPQGWLYPQLVVQAYIDLPRRVGALRAVAVARTADLMKMVQQQIENNRTSANRTTNAEFYIVHWEAMRNAGFPVRRLYGSQLV